MGEDGRLTDSKGRTIDFKNTMIILTSNVGAKAIQNAAGSGSGLGFDSPDTNDEDSEYTRMAELVNEELKRFFRPEFLNRLDEVIIFQQLTKHVLSEIIDPGSLVLVDVNDQKELSILVDRSG